MKPVAVALLATLLPTLLIIAFLILLSLELYLRLNDLRPSPQPVVELIDRPSIVPKPVLPPGRKKERSILSADISDLWAHDVNKFLWELRPDRSLPASCNVLNDEDHGYEWVKEQLQAVGYDRAPIETMMKLLRSPISRSLTIHHITASLILTMADPENKGSFSLLSFSPEMRKSLYDAFHALEGIQFSGYLSNILFKIPAQIVAEHGAFNKENEKTLRERLNELFVPRATDVSSLVNAGDLRLYLSAFQMDEWCANAVMLQLNMLASRRQFKFIWGEVTERSLTFVPAVYSYADKNGVPLGEPELWSDAWIVDPRNGRQSRDELRHFCNVGNPPDSGGEA